jgi:hypothetical protein
LLNRTGLAIGFAALASACSYPALKVRGDMPRVISISCNELHESCTPQDLRFEAVQFDMATAEDVGSRLRKYIIQARCDIDGNHEVAFGPYHQGNRIDLKNNVLGTKDPDGLYHYTVYALPNSEGLGSVASSSFKNLRCSIWGVQMGRVAFPRTNYIEMTSAQFRESHDQFMRLGSSPNKSLERTRER